jgi:hypothetical protein
MGLEDEVRLAGKPVAGILEAWKKRFGIIGVRWSGRIGGVRVRVLRLGGRLGLLGVAWSSKGQEEEKKCGSGAGPAPNGARACEVIYWPDDPHRLGNPQNYY